MCRVSVCLSCVPVVSQLERWVSSFAALNGRVKEFGELGHWAAVLEADMTAVAQTLANTVAFQQQHAGNALEDGGEAGTPQR